MNYFEYLNCGIYIGFLSLCAIQDALKRSVNGIIYIIFGIAGIVLSLIADRAYSSVIIAAFPGIVMTAVAVLTNESIGMGDALFYIVSALYMDIDKLMLMLFISVFICGMAALVIIVICRVKNRDSRTVAIPYLTYIFPVGMIMILL